MTETETPIPSPLELATAARVACTLLEEEIADLIRRPSPLRAQRLTDRARQTWQRIDALAARIEDQQAEIERLQIVASESITVHVFDTEQAMREFSEQRLRPSGSATVTIPDQPAPEFVAETIPAHRPLPSDLRPLPPGQRPPGFEAVRARMRRSGRRTDAIERIKGEDAWDRDSAKRRPRTSATQWITPRKAEKPWRRFVKAVEEKRLPLGEPIFIGTIVEVCECSTQTVANIQADLVIEGAPYRMRRDGPTKATIIRA